MSILSAFVMPHPPLIVPEVGRGEEKKIQATVNACEETAKRIAALAPETVIVISPHSIMYADYFHISPGESARGDLRKFAPDVPQVSVKYDASFVASLEEEAGAAEIFAGTLGEKDARLDHGTLIPLHFLQAVLPDVRIVRISISGCSFADHYRLGQCIAKTAEKLPRKVVILASADLSHRLNPEGPYGLAPEGAAFDKETTDALSQGDFLRLMSFDPVFCEKAGECGLRSLIIMAGALDSTNVLPELLSYEGPFGVGYAVVTFLPGAKNANRNFLDQHLLAEKRRLSLLRSKEDPYVRLARQALESYIVNGQFITPSKDLPPEMLSCRAGVFVSLKNHGNLRGCIGTIAPVTESIAAEICRNAVSSATSDNRFDPVDPSEINDLVYSVDVLSPAEPIDSSEELDVQRYGVIVTKGGRRGLLLPNLDGVDTVAQQITIAKQKAGISPTEDVQLERFEVVRHK